MHGEMGRKRTLLSDIVMPAHVLRWLCLCELGWGDRCRGTLCPLPVHSARTLRPHPPPGEYPPPVTLPGMAAPVRRQCVCCHGLIKGGFHSCKTCRVDLHSVVACDKQWMPSDGCYFCSQACVQKHNGSDGVAEADKMPLRQRPTSAVVEPVVAAPIAPALQPSQVRHRM